MDLTAVREHVRSVDPDDFRDGDAWLAGGTVLFSAGSAVITRLLDLTGAGWTPIEVHPDAVGDRPGVELAATCTIADLWQLPGHPLAGRWPAMELVRACCDSFVASWKIWHTSTVGGNLATALPAGPMISLTAALDGVVTVWGPGGSVRDVGVLDLVTGAGRTGLRPAELIRSIRLPAGTLTRQTAFRRMSLSNRGRSAALLIGTRTPAGVAVTITAATTRPVRIDLPATADPATVSAMIDAAVPADLWHDDEHGDPDWRAALSRRFAVEIHAELTAR